MGVGLLYYVLQNANDIEEVKKLQADQNVGALHYLDHGVQNSTALLFVLDELAVERDEGASLQHISDRMDFHPVLGDLLALWVE